MYMCFDPCPMYFTPISLCFPHFFSQFHVLFFKLILIEPFCIHGCVTVYWSIAQDPLP